MPTIPSKTIPTDKAVRLAAYLGAANFADVPDMLWAGVKVRVRNFERSNRKRRAGNGEAVEAAIEFDFD